MRIVSLSMEHEQALSDFLRDFAERGETHIPGYFGGEDTPHSEIVQRLADWARGEGLQNGWVASTTLFLEDGGRLLGVANVRHRLTEHLERHGGHVGYSVRPSERCKGYATRLLKAAKELAQVLGIERMLVTCSPENVASARVIEKCEGVFEDETFFEPAGETVRRYWISLLGDSVQG